jgi:putative phosphoesterase
VLFATERAFDFGVNGNSRISFYLVTTINVGVISDTHGLLRPEALAVLAGSDYIIHAGDVGNPAILPALESIAPLMAIRGNIDTQPWARHLPASNVLEVGDVLIYIVHNLGELDLKPGAAGFEAVIYGHSHKPAQETKNGVLYFNPGSAGPRRFRLPITVGRLKISGKKLSAEIIELKI